MKVLFFSRGYGNMAGGIEKMSLDLARGLTQRGHEITIVSLDAPSAISFFEWPKDVKWIKLNIGEINRKNSLITRFKRVVAIRKIATKEKFDSAVGFQVGSFALLKLSLIGLRIKVVAAERNAPTLFNYIKCGNIKKPFSNLILYTANTITIQFEEYEKYYPKFLKAKLAVTPNWVKQYSNIDAKSHSNKFRVLFLGRLTYQKNVEILLKAFSELPDRFELIIVGDGPEKNKLINEAKSLNITNIYFKDPTSNVVNIFKDVDILCLPSRWEGFPNVVAEALSLATPCIGFAECAGIPQLINDGLNGVIALGEGNYKTLRDSIIRAEKIIFNPVLIANSVKKYTFENFLKKWEFALKKS